MGWFNVLMTEFIVACSLIPRYNKFTKVLIHVPSRSPIHAESESSIDEDNIFAISPPIVESTSWNLRDVTSHRQGVSIRIEKNWFRWLTSHPKPWVGKLKGDKSGKERSDFNVLQRKQIDEKSIQILYNLIGRLGRRDNR